MALDKKDFEYMSREIYSHKIYRFLFERGSQWDNSKRLDWLSQQVVFYEQFLNDPDCPPRVRKELAWYLGYVRGQLKEVKVFFENFQQRRFLIERWQEICR